MIFIIVDICFSLQTDFYMMVEEGYVFRELPSSGKRKKFAEEQKRFHFIPGIQNLNLAHKQTDSELQVQMRKERLSDHFFFI